MPRLDALMRMHADAHRGRPPLGLLVEPAGMRLGPGPAFPGQQEILAVDCASRPGLPSVAPCLAELPAVRPAPVRLRHRRRASCRRRGSGPVPARRCWVDASPFICVSPSGDGFATADPSPCRGRPFCQYGPHRAARTAVIGEGLPSSALPIAAARPSHLSWCSSSNGSPTDAQPGGRHDAWPGSRALPG